MNNTISKSVIKTVHCFIKQNIDMFILFLTKGGWFEVFLTPSEEIKCFWPYSNVMLTYLSTLKKSGK